MNRDNILFVGLGGAGGRLVDSILDVDARFQGLFVNTSITDLQSLNNFNDTVKNYYCISTQNGVGRNRSLGKEYAEQRGYNIIDLLYRYQQDTIYFVSSLGGGSGSAILSVLLRAISSMKADGDFDKTVNVIGILPSLKSPEVILKNAISTWDEVLENPCINSMMFINNDAQISEVADENDKELKINEKFAETFDSIFEIPAINGIKFDNGNLSNVLKDKGCLYFYDLPNECSSIEVAMIKAEKNSILAKMYRDENNTELLDDGTKSVKCGYLGISFVNENFNKDYIDKLYIPSKETYSGINADRNILLVSGCFPPINSIRLIEHELEDRKKYTSVQNELDFSKFKINKQVPDTHIEQKLESNDENVSSKGNKVVKKTMKKNLFKR